jgi:hypothetical protein
MVVTDTIRINYKSYYSRYDVQEHDLRASPGRKPSEAHHAFEPFATMYRRILETRAPPRDVNDDGDEQGAYGDAYIRYCIHTCTGDIKHKT